MNKAIFHIQQAINALPHDFAYQQVRSYLSTAIQQIEHVDKKAEKRKKELDTLAKLEQKKKEDLAKRVAEYNKLHNVEDIKT
jgi:phage shock protein A